MDTIWLKMRMRALKIKLKDLAAEIGISVPAVHHKLNNRRPTSLEEAAIIARCLKMTPVEIVKHLMREE